MGWEHVQLNESPVSLSLGSPIFLQQPKSGSFPIHFSEILNVNFMSSPLPLLQEREARGHCSRQGCKYQRGMGIRVPRAVSI